MTEHRMTAGEWALLGILSLVWGASFFFFKILVVALPPFTLVLGRVGFAALALHVVMIARGTPFRLPRDQFGPFLLLGLVNNVVPFVLIAIGETRITSGLAAILNATTPLFTVLVAHAFTEVKLTPAKTAGLLLGMAGVVVLTGPGVLRGLGDDLTGELCCLLAAVTYGFGTVYSRRFNALPPLTVVTGQSTAGVICLAPAVLLFDRPWTMAMPGLHIWAAWLGIALPSTAFGYLMFFRLLKTVGPTNLVLVTLLVPVSALLLGALFLGEAVTLHALAGMALIGLSLAAIDGRLWRRLSNG
jgi:drug/metabolite transporter (DMT)-like permease